MEIFDPRNPAPRPLLDWNPFTTCGIHLIASRDGRLPRLRKGRAVKHSVQDARIWRSEFFHDEARLRTSPDLMTSQALRRPVIALLNAVRSPSPAAPHSEESRDCHSVVIQRDCSTFFAAR